MRTMSTRSKVRGQGASLSGLVGLFALALVLSGLTGCRTKPATLCGTEVGPCDTIHGRLPQGRCNQAFTFEGVESSLLDFSICSDDASVAAPQVTLTNPEGKGIPLAAHTTTPEGAATTRIQGVVLLRSGTYHVTVTPAVDYPVYYRFDYTLRFPPVEGMRLDLVACKPQPVTISAPRGSMVTVSIRPLRGSCTQVQFEGVEDPWGGRALAPERQLPGVPPPQMSHGQDGSTYLNFVAPIPGRYTILTAAKPGRDGPAMLDVRVRPTGGKARQLVHPNRSPGGYGMTAGMKVQR